MCGARGARGVTNMRLPTHRVPTPPGEILQEEWLKPMNLTQLALAKRMGVDIQLVNGIVNGRRSVRLLDIQFASSDLDHATRYPNARRVHPEPKTASSSGLLALTDPEIDRKRGLGRQKPAA